MEASRAAFTLALTLQPSLASQGLLVGDRFFSPSFPLISC